MQIKYWMLIGVVVMVSCKKPPPPTAQQIVNKTIENAGGSAYNKAHIRFDFRDKQYTSIRNNFEWQYERKYTDSLQGVIKDILTSKGTQRFVQDSLIVLPDSIANSYGNSVNSVHYFAQLPYGLNDKAVQKTLLGEVSLKKQKYYKIQVAFTQEGGGDDFEDVYLYFIHKENFTVDYLAYEFHTNGGGARFRQAYNPRIVNGIRFVDYKNFKTQKKPDNFLKIEELFENNTLELLSTIELKNIQVTFAPLM